MKREIGWKPMPTSLKVLFVFAIIGIAGSINSIFGVYQMGYSFFGFYSKGIAAILLSLLFPLVAQVILAIGFWKRATWAGWYGIIFYVLLIVSGLLSLLTLNHYTETMSQWMVERTGEPLPESFDQIFHAAMAVAITLGSAVNLVFAVLLLRIRNYF